MGAAGPGRAASPLLAARLIRRLAGMPEACVIVPRAGSCRACAGRAAGAANGMSPRAARARNTVSPPPNYLSGLHQRRHVVMT